MASLAEPAQRPDSDHQPLPAPKSEVKLIDPENMDELVELLHNEAKVI